jgi:hypothetical protein
MDTAPATASRASHLEAGGQQPRPTPTSVRIELKGASPVDALQAHLILRPARKLTQSVSEAQGGR